MGRAGNGSPRSLFMDSHEAGFESLLAAAGLSLAARPAATLRPAVELFPGGRDPEAALAGLWLRWGDWARAHSIAQDIPTAEGSYWHAILHRQEPDPGNSAYWFRRVGRHAIFPALHTEAARLGWSPAAEWDPIAFLDLYEHARKKGSAGERSLVTAVEAAEWRLLFSWCVEPGA